MAEGNGVPILGQGDNKAKQVTRSQKCHGCSQMVEFQIPGFETINSETISGIIFAHPQAQTCPNCGQAHQMVVAGFKGVAYAFVPIQVKDKSPIIAPPPGMVV